MKKLITFCLLIAFTLSATIPMPVSAINTKPSGKRPPPMSTEDDGYRAETDPLPEWLFLPDGVDEASLSYDGNQSDTLTITQPGTTRWQIKTQRSGASITYTYFENDKRVFVIKTTKNYAKFRAYVVTAKGKLKASKAINPEGYFDDATPISFEAPQKKTYGFSLFETASAYVDVGDGNAAHQANTKRVKAKLTKRQINKLNHKVGFKGSDAAIANRVVWYESGGGKTQAVACENNTATGFNPPYGGARGVEYCKNKGASAGRGLYQISSHWHPKCTDKCAFSPERNAKYAYALRKKGGWTQWCSYGGCGSNDPNPAGRGPAMQ